MSLQKVIEEAITRGDIPLLDSLYSLLNQYPEDERLDLQYLIENSVPEIIANNYYKFSNRNVSFAELVQEYYKNLTEDVLSQDTEYQLNYLANASQEQVKLFFENDTTMDVTYMEFGQLYYWLVLKLPIENMAPYLNSVNADNMDEEIFIGFLTEAKRNNNYAPFGVLSETEFFEEFPKFKIKRAIKKLDVNDEVAKVLIDTQYLIHRPYILDIIDIIDINTDIFSYIITHPKCTDQNKEDFADLFKLGIQEEIAIAIENVYNNMDKIVYDYIFYNFMCYKLLEDKNEEWLIKLDALHPIDINFDPFFLERRALRNTLLAIRK